MNSKLIELQHMMLIFGNEFNMKTARDYLMKLGYDISIVSLKHNFKNGIFTLIKTYI